MRFVFIGLLVLFLSVIATAKPDSIHSCSFGELPVGAIFHQNEHLFQKMAKLVRTSDGSLKQVPDWSYGYFNAQWLNIPNNENDGWRLLSAGGRDWWFSDLAEVETGCSSSPCHE